MSFEATAADPSFAIPPDAPSPEVLEGDDADSLQHHSTVVLKKLDIRSLTTFSAAFYLFLALASVVATGILLFVGSVLGVNQAVESFVRSLSFDEFTMAAGSVLGWTLLFSLFSAAAMTLTTIVVGVIYNLVCDLTGGIRVVVAPDRTKMDRDEGP